MTEEEAVVILHPAFVERTPVDLLARELLKWDRWLDLGTDRYGRLRFYARPVTVVNIIPARSGRS